MPSNQPVRGIVNGHWEPSAPRRPKVLTGVRSSLAKLLEKLSHTVEPAEAVRAERDRESTRHAAE